MCTDMVLQEKIRMYVEVSQEVSKLEKLKKELSAFIVEEMDSRNADITDPEKLDTFQGQKVITSRLQENATSAGKQYLKDTFNHDIDKYLKVTCSRYVNAAAAKKI